MKLLTFKTQNEPGFRLNLTDLLLLLLLVVLSYFIFTVTRERGLYLLPLYIGLSFFLFCNVFRIGNRLEAFWYVPFIILFLYGYYFMENFWPLVLLVFEPLKAALIIIRIRRGGYEGILYNRLWKYGRTL